MVSNSTGERGMSTNAYLLALVTAISVTGANNLQGGANLDANQAPVCIQSVAYSETCFLEGERVDGMNKICFYKCVSGAYAITIGAVQLCPLTVQKN
jgi:hypothetical protein